MSSGLPPAHRQWLDDFDQKEAVWADIDPADVRGRVRVLLDRYPMPGMAIARLFMEQIAATAGLIGRYDTVKELEGALAALVTNQGVIASALSRRGRGKPEV